MYGYNVGIVEFIFRRESTKCGHRRRRTAVRHFVLRNIVNRLLIESPRVYLLRPCQFFAYNYETPVIVNRVFGRHLRCGFFTIPTRK